MKRNQKVINGKTGFLLAVVMSVLLCGCSKFGSEQETETELGEGQRTADITVVSIVGNELTYYEEETETETEVVAETELTEIEGMSEAGDAQETEALSESAEVSQMSSSGEAPDVSQMGGGERPDMSQMSDGERPDMSQMGGGNMPDRGQMGGGRPGMRQQDSTGETGADSSAISQVSTSEISDEVQTAENSAAGQSERAVENQSSDDSTADTSQAGGNGEMPDMSQAGGNGEMPDMSQFSDGEMPDMSQFGDGEIPDMSTRFGEDSESGASGRMQGGRGSQVETKTVYLPVSVVVHTGTTSTATFSILEAGDELTVLYETNAAGEEVITEIWMKGSGQ